MELNLLYLNDVHGYLKPHGELFYDGKREYIETAGGYSRIAAMVKKYRRENNNMLLFDGGDTFHGTFPVVESKGGILLPILNKLSFDAMVGHWDFGYGPKQLKQLLAGLNYPMLGINVYNQDGSLFLKPILTIQAEDIKVGVIGICSDIIDKTMPSHFSKGLKITNGVEELPAHIKQLKDQHCDIIILLSHNGFPQDVVLLEQIDGIDVCLSAHTHNRLYKPVLVKKTILIQCGCHGSFLGHLKLLIEKGKVTGHDYKLIKIDESIEPDKEMDEIIESVLLTYSEKKSLVVGHTDKVLHRYDTLNSSMDNLLLEAIQFATNTELAFSNGWRYGAPIDIGNISEEDLYNIIPMNPPVSTVEMTGEEIINMLEENLERTFSPDPMKQMGGYVKRCSGLKINIRIENPEGHRIQEVYIGKDHLDAKRIYHAGFVTSQGVPEKYGSNRRELNLSAVEAMKKFLTFQPEFSPSGKTFFLV